MTRLATLALLVVFALARPAAAETILDLTAAIDPVENRITAQATFTFDAPRAAAFTLAKSLIVKAVETDTGEALEHRRDGEHLTVAAARAVVIAYEGRLAKRPLSAQGGRLAPAAWTPVPYPPLHHHRLTLTTRAPFVAVAPGRLESEATAGARRTATFTSEAPGEPPTAFVGPYRVTERMVKGRRLRTYFHAELTPLADGYLDDTARYLDRYETAIGAYPFSGFAIVSGPDPVGLGYPGLTYLGRRVVKLPFIRKTSLGHEVLHSWWGNGVFIDAAQGNWAEGLTTFMADYAFAEDAGHEAAREKRLGWLRDYAALPPDRDAAPSTFISKTHDASQIIGYNKVAFFFHMLRDRIGAEPFNQSLRRFWTDHKFRAASWGDLRRAVEAETGHDLTAFFAQWLERPGAPALSVKDTQQLSGGVAFTVEQEGAPYDLSLTAEIVTDTGTAHRSFRVSGPQTHVRLNVAGRVERLTLDPDSTVFRRLHPQETPPTLRDIALASDVLSVIVYGREAERLAAQSLIRTLMAEPPFFVAPYLSPTDTDPFIVAGPADEVAAYLGTINILDAPPEVEGRGTAQVWTGRRGGAPFLVITAEKARHVAAMVRALSHYGRRSWLVFDDDHVIDKGLWPVQTGPLTVTF